MAGVGATCSWRGRAQRDLQPRGLGDPLDAPLERGGGPNSSSAAGRRSVSRRRSSRWRSPYLSTAVSRIAATASRSLAPGPGRASLQAGQRLQRLVVQLARQRCARARGLDAARGPARRRSARRDAGRGARGEAGGSSSSSALNSSLSLRRTRPAPRDGGRGRSAHHEARVRRCGPERVAQLGGQVAEAHRAPALSTTATAPRPERVPRQVGRQRPATAVTTSSRPGPAGQHPRASTSARARSTTSSSTRPRSVSSPTARRPRSSLHHVDRPLSSSSRRTCSLR